MFSTLRLKLLYVCVIRIEIGAAHCKQYFRLRQRHIQSLRPHRPTNLLLSHRFWSLMRLRRGKFFMALMRVKWSSGDVRLTSLPLAAQQQLELSRCQNSALAPVPSQMHAVARHSRSSRVEPSIDSTMRVLLARWCSLNLPWRRRFDWDHC